MTSTARSRVTGQAREIAPRMPRAAKTVEEMHREAGVIRDNVRCLAARDRVTHQVLARHAGISERSLRDRLARPWEFRLEELEGLARLLGVSVRQLTAPMRLED